MAYRTILVCDICKRPPDGDSPGYLKAYHTETYVSVHWVCNECSLRAIRKKWVKSWDECFVCSETWKKMQSGELGRDGNPRVE